jgi:hypothetical protein
MGDPPVRARALLALAAALALGCAQPLGQLRRLLREPGERLAAFPEAVAEEYDCGGRALPFFRLERSELNPPRVRAGGEFNHRRVYALCPRGATEVVRGTLVTRIRFEGRPIVTERLADFELKPGRWIVDAFVKLPARAEPGVYALEVRFESGSVQVRSDLTFAVEG